jgi:hypothetical protein
VTSPVTSSGRGRGALAAVMGRLAAPDVLEAFAPTEATLLPAPIARTAPAITQKRIRDLFEADFIS